MDLSIYRQSNLLYNQEKLSKYKPGGFHPVTLGDTFKDGRYEVHHKLGWGGFSTVWLAYDRESKEWVSLKIMTADSPQSKEVNTLKSLQRHAAGNLSSKYIIQLLDSFSHAGPNGTHQCLIFELLGPTVHHVLVDYNESEDKLEPEDIFRILKQLLESVKFIHDSGMCHGDISDRNIGFTCTNLSHANKEELFKVLGEPEIEPLTRLDLKSAEWVDWIDEDEEDIRLFDFGESFIQGEEPEKLAQPGGLKAPETIFMDEFDYRVDLWRVGFIAYSLMFASYPFRYMGQDDHLAFQMNGFVERLPAEWKSQWEGMKESSRPDLELEESGGRFKLEYRFAERIDGAALAPVLPIIRGLMRFLPSSRVSAAEALHLLESIEGN